MARALKRLAILRLPQSDVALVLTSLVSYCLVSIPVGTLNAPDVPIWNRARDSRKLAAQLLDSSNGADYGGSIVTITRATVINCHTTKDPAGDQLELIGGTNDAHQRCQHR